MLRAFGRDLRSVAKFGKKIPRFPPTRSVWQLEMNFRKIETLILGADLLGGNFSGFFIDRAKNLISTEEYSGGYGTSQVIRIQDCLPVGKSAKYCGGAFKSTFAGA